MNRRLLATVVLVLGVPTLAILAQTAKKPGTSTVPKKAASCARVDTTAAWYKRQWATIDETGLKWSDDGLRSALLDAAGLTVATALAPQLGWQNVDAPMIATPAESAMVANLKRRGGRGRGAGGGRGASAEPWPLKSTVGAAGVRAVFVIMQNDSALQESGMHHLMEPGPDEDIAVDIAILNDRTRRRVGRKQLFGTQLQSVNGKLVPLPIEDSAHVDLRRDDAGLPPLAWSVCNANFKG